VDLDDFKGVNDSMGHEAGDQVLVSVAARLNGVVRAQDTVARLGGDEFGVLLEETDEKGAKEVADRAAKALGAPLTIGNDQVSTSASIGLATRYEDEEIDTLLGRADVAMYAAKSRGPGLWQAFEPDMDASIQEANTTRSQLERAVRNNEFVVHYQPIVDIETQSPVAVEALVRWDHPEKGLLPPSEFLEAAEESGHILYIDKWVLNEACRQVKLWQTEAPNASSLSACVNLSARQFEHPGLAGEVAEALRTSGLAPEHLTVELTETVLVRDVEAATVELKKLKEIGVKIALDDFGTGYSSLNYLSSFPIDVLKIDRSFVSAIGERPDQLEVGLALVEFSRRLGLVTVAEGIEELGQLRSLSDLGCELGQGYLFAKPLAAEKLEAFLKEGVTAIVG
jgi:diguanylate cyclase (GGDEF)-like protein